MTERMETAEGAASIGSDADAWDNPPRVASPGNAAELAPMLSVAGFEGPLDWLLEMARAQKIDLARLSIGALIDAFSTALQAALARPDGRPAQLGRLGDWLVMAATLAWLRSRLLLPADAPEAQAAKHEAEALRRQLLSRAQMAVAADWLERWTQLGRDVFARGLPETRDAGRVGDITELLRACLVVLRVPEQQTTAYRPRPPPFWTVKDAIGRIEVLLGELPDRSPLAAFLPKIDHEEPSRDLRCKAAVASTVVAGLELARCGGLTLEQEQEVWTPILVFRSEKVRADDHEAGRAA